MRLAKLPVFTRSVPSVWLLAAAAVLTTLPLDSLIAVWSDDVSQSAAVWLATVCCGALLGRLVGEQLPGSATHQRYVLSLLLCGAALRTAAPLLRFKACSSAGLMLDGYALGVLTGAQRERRPLPPARLALLGALWLPTEVVLQRALSAAMQPLIAC